MRWFLAALLVSVVTTASAQFLSNSLRSPMLQGSLGMPGLGSPATGGNPPPAGCDGSIDLSTGCVAPMLGVL